MLLDPQIPFRRNYLLHVLMVAYFLFWVVTAFSPTNRLQWLMENILPVAVICTLAFSYKKFRFSNLSYVFIFIFLCLHAYAAHYTYEGTPFDMWLKSSFHTHRSYFDRVVHFVFGLLWTYPIREILIRVAGVRGFWSYVIPATVSFSCSALFEIVEMLVAVMSGQAGEQYMGLQGDIYDSQKDMALGLIGAVISMAVLAWINRGKHGRDA